MSAEAEAQLRRRNLRTLAALATVFLLPLVLAFYIYYATGWRPAAHVNHGTLITPVRPLPVLAPPGVRVGAAAPVALFRARWSLVYVGDGACDPSCRRTLYVMRQTRLGLNNDMTRVERVFLASADCCDREFLAREHSGVVLVDASGPGAAALLGEFPAADREHTLFLVDPLGNLMMSYDARQDPRGLLEDLKKLLRLSQIG
jgi:hypothetical protein